MTEAHIKEATKMLGWFFDRCGKVPHYKGMMYVKNADNLKILLDSVVGRIEKENSQQIEKIYNEENSYTVHCFESKDTCGLCTNGYRLGMCQTHKAGQADECQRNTG